MLGDVAETDELMVRLYRDHKRRAGYTDEQTVRKAAALEGVLVPLTARFDVELIKDAGFRTVECLLAVDELRRVGGGPMTDHPEGERADTGVFVWGPTRSTSSVASTSGSRRVTSRGTSTSSGRSSGCESGARAVLLAGSSDDARGGSADPADLVDERPTIAHGARALRRAADRLDKAANVAQDTDGTATRTRPSATSRTGTPSRSSSRRQVRATSRRR